MDISRSPALLRDMRGPIDGREFFSKWPFCSRHFVAATIASLTSVALDSFLVCRYWSGISSTLVVLVGMDYFVLLSWFGAVRHIRRIRAAFSQGSFENIDAGSPMDIALGVAAGVIFDWLVYISGAILIMLIYIGTHIVGHPGGWPRS